MVPPGRSLSAGGVHPKDDYLRPPRLRRSWATEKKPSSGQHSLVVVELPGASLSSDEHLLVGADIFLRAGASSPEENTKKDDYLRPPRLRRSSAAEKKPSSGQHSLVGVELPGANLSSGEHPPCRRRPPPVIRRSSPAHFAGELLLY